MRKFSSALRKINWGEDDVTAAKDEAIAVKDHERLAAQDDELPAITDNEHHPTKEDYNALLNELAITRAQLAAANEIIAAKGDVIEASQMQREAGKGAIDMNDNASILSSEPVEYDGTRKRSASSLKTSCNDTADDASIHPEDAHLAMSKVTDEQVGMLVSLLWIPLACVSHSRSSLQYRLLGRRANLLLRRVPTKKGGRNSSIVSQ